MPFRDLPLHPRVLFSNVRAVPVAALLLVACAGAPASDLFADTASGTEPTDGGLDAASPRDGDPDGAAPDAEILVGDASVAGGAEQDAAVSGGGLRDGNTGPVPADAAAALDAALRTDAGPPVSYTPDACLAPTYAASCDASCVLRNCRLLECTDIPTQVWTLNEQTMGRLPWRFRTVATTDALACATRCGGATVARGVVRFELDFATPTNLTIRVGPPWRIAVNPRYAFCVNEATATSSTSSCVSREFTKAMITVFTTEPNAPPRDIVVDRFPTLYCSETP